MRIHNYINKKLKAYMKEEVVSGNITEMCDLMSYRKKILFGFVVFLGICSFVIVGLKNCKVSMVPTEFKVKVANPTIAEVAIKRENLSVPKGVIKANPFVPYRDIEGNLSLDVPEYTIADPVEKVQESSEGARIMDTIVSGILYDKFSPSAILNIEGNDYLVKKGDVVNNYEILNILKDSVTVKLGANTYKAGIGEILTEGTITHNNVSNLSNKFGGERR